MLATLVLEAGRTVSDEHLSNMLWAWEPPTTMNAQIYTYVSRLRKRLGPQVKLIRQPRGYRLYASDAAIDLTAFARAADRGRAALARQGYAEAAKGLRTALDLFRGLALGNVTDFLADAERPRLEEMRLATLEDWIEAELALGRHHGLVPDLTSLIAEHPMRERMRAQLMTALYRCDRQVDALAVFDAGRRILAEELGIDPGATLARAHQAVLKGSFPPVVPRRIEAVMPAPVPAMLPPDLPEFVGRRAELAWLRQQLKPQAIVRPRRAFLTGMAGVGKSALALHAAHSLREQFPDGQLYADLCLANGDAKPPAEILTCFLHALGVDPADRKDSLDDLVRLYRTHSTGRRMLVVLDNADVQSQLASLLPNNVEAAVIVTSRRHLSGASGRDTAVLAPFAEEEAMQLLAALVEPDRIAVDLNAAEEVLRFCAGLPLAVRIAAIRLAARPDWPTARLATRLANPDTRLNELSFGVLGVRDAILGSFRDVSGEHQRALAALTAFGTEAFPAQAAARRLRISETAAEQTLGELVDARLLESVETGQPGHTSYRLHELVLLTILDLPGMAEARYTAPWHGLARAVVNLRSTG
ncbi:BTAD domain-containing putative transcriptional regulator [Streptomyces sp. NPDC046557]|uniref:AfsR/SARP family transcriptional regulator n=1 Tax=Streptomyces sp. NPDC046557 TaxID=3155372 RepID=UPI0034024CDD